MIFILDDLLSPGYRQRVLPVPGVRVNSPVLNIVMATSVSVYKDNEYQVTMCSAANKVLFTEAKIVVKHLTLNSP